MAGTTYNIRIVLSSDAGRTSRDLDDVGSAGRRAGAGAREAGEGAQGAGKQFASLGGLVKEAAANFAGYLTAQAVFQGLTQAARFAYDTILGFDQQMTESLAIMGSVSEQTRDSMEQTARTVAVDYNAAVADVAQAYYFLASAGYDAETSQLAVGQVTAFAKAGMFDLEVATSLAADAQNAMGLKSESSSENLVQLTRITDVLTKANIDANGSVQDFAKALTNKAAAGARLAGVSLESTVAVLEAFAAQGLKGKRAGEAFTIVLRDLQDKSQANGEAFKAMGIEVYDAQGKFAGFPKIVGQLEQSLKGLSVEQANAKINTLGFTAEGGAYLKTLLGMSGAIADYEVKLRSAGGATQAIAEKQMQSMVEKLKHLKVLAAEVALQGFDKLVVAVSWLGEKFGPTFSNVVRLLASAGEFVKPLVEGMMLIAGAGVVGGLTAIAKVLETVTGLLVEHEGVVQALATVALVALVARLGQAAAAFASLAADMVAFKLYEFAGGIDKVIAGVGSIGAAFSAARAGGAGFLSSIGAGASALWGMVPAALAAGAAVAAIGLIIYGVQSKLNDGERAAEAFLKSLRQKHDVTSLQGMRDVIKATADEVERLGHTGSTMGERLNVPAVIEAEGKWNKLKDTLGDMQTELASREHLFADLARDIASTQGPSAQSAEGIASITRRLDEIATKEKIDLTQPGAAGRLKDLTEASMAASSPMQQLRQSFLDVADASATAEDRVKAYKSALDALAGVHIAAKEAEISFASSLQTVSEKVGAGVNLLDVYNAKNREAASAVLGAANAGIQHAVSVYEETGSLTQANAVLGQHREQLINSMTATGMSRQAAIDYINTLGLTPKNIETLARLNKEQASAAAKELTNEVNEAARHRQGSIDIDTSTASGKIRALMAQMDDVSRRQARQMGLANGGILRGYADGGVERFAGGTERHVAQIAPAGAMRLWAEPETGGEAYIPLAEAKRGRSEQIMQQVAAMFGYKTFKMADGGYTMEDAMRELSWATSHAPWGVNRDFSFWGESDAFRAMRPMLNDMFWNGGGAFAGFNFDNPTGLLEMLTVKGWADTVGRTYGMAATREGAQWGASFTVAPGAFQFNGGRGQDAGAIERAVTAALNQFTKDMRRELKTRRVAHPA